MKGSKQQMIRKLDLYGELGNNGLIITKRGIIYQALSFLIIIKRTY